MHKVIGDFANDIIVGTGKRANLTATFQELLDHFGQPSIVGSGDDKVQLTWVFSDGDKVITIYDWKTETPISEITEWSIGGKGFTNLRSNLSFQELPNSTVGTVALVRKEKDDEGIIEYPFLTYILV